nr:MAG TPA: hypothetical protein [Bacteriophage sp.]
MKSMENNLLGRCMTYRKISKYQRCVKLLS